MKTATVRQSRRLRDGRQLIEVDTCPHCDATHWLMTNGTTLAECLTHTNRPRFIDGLGDKRADR